MASALEEIKKMQKQGVSEDKIIADLREKGFPHKEILEALSQTKIKAAVEQEESNNSENSSPKPTSSAAYSDSKSTTPQVMSGEDQNSMEQSLLSQTPSPQNATEQPSGNYFPQQAPQNPQGSDMQTIPSQNQDYQNYEEYSPNYPAQENYPAYSDNSSYYQQGYSSDIISEISEQVVAEKLSEIRKGVEKIIDFKTTMESKVETLSERLQRIEKIIDTLQSSILRKVGDYVTNVDDIKKELVETQKTFAKLLPEMKKTTHKKKTRKSSSKK